ncbi:uncharacterized protein [Chelonus insularis]|uniref:uncharacterized protein n=1 Tax=Chelonus insularis TaxID=460826 RepID=UPI00158BD9B7|nr:uncharacterized protein LOC118069234 [Chelonus insularis]
MNLSPISSIILTIFITSEALICYHCRYCDDIFKAPYVIERDCSSMFENAACEKVVYELSNSSRGVIIRRCQFRIFLANTSTSGAYLSENKKYPVDYIQQHYLQVDVRQNTSRAYVSRISVFHCQTNYCNSTSSTSGSSLIILIFVLTFLLL